MAGAACHAHSMDPPTASPRADKTEIIRPPPLPSPFTHSTSQDSEHSHFASVWDALAPWLPRTQSFGHTGSCAIVGNGPQLGKSTFGHEIDTHAKVFRFNKVRSSSSTLKLLLKCQSLRLTQRKRAALDCRRQCVASSVLLVSKHHTDC